MSRLRSNRGAKAPASTPAARPAAGRPAAGRRPGVLVQAPKSDIFVALLGISLAAILLACLLMIMILWRYDFKANAKLAALESRARAVNVADRGDGDLVTRLLAA